MSEPPELTKYLTDLERPFDSGVARPYEPQELIRFALRSGRYWADLALEWLDAGAPTAGLEFILDDAGHDRSLPQPVRHRALRLLKQTRPYMWTAWVKGDTQKGAVQTTLNRFIGRAITGCRYVEIDYEGGKEGWRGPSRDELDYGLELDLDNGETWSIVWEQFNLNEGLNVRPGSLVPESVRAEGSAIRDVSSRWLELGPGVLAEVRLGWAVIHAGPGYDRHGNKVTEAEESQLSLTAIQLIGNDTRTTVVTLYGADEIRVYFSLAAAREDGVVLAPAADA
ncbi:hypothetical protein [Nocardioides sp. 503]|uniref:hypothetical protein n=1 Tax=Nocardioides sp. 503 TaxID=2508326 RepID=UPI00106F986D|nr:hypothetical protein [Nocardioides sp. 503]